MAKTDIERLIQKHEGLTHSEDRKVLSHAQREKQDWILNTIMIEGCDIPFQFKRKKLYQKLKGARVNLTYYQDTQKVAGMEFEFMKVVRIRVS
jgi:hypothetical protein